LAAATTAVAAATTAVAAATVIATTVTIIAPRQRACHHGGGRRGRHQKEFPTFHVRILLSRSTLGIGRRWDSN
jgi:Spy/CpxP family protein refolding chaperone